MTNVERIIGVYNGTDPRVSDRDIDTLRTVGGRWYQEARSLIRKDAEDTGHPVDVVAAVYAACSINATWKSNVTIARRCLAGDIRGLAVVQRLVRLALAEGGDAAIDSIGKDARKVRSFYGTFRGRKVAPVIDRWAMSVATGEHRVPSGKEYDRIANDYIDAATILGIHPSILQAATWAILRGSAQ